MIRDEAIDRMGERPAAGATQDQPAAEDRPRYTAPALEKGLDILELLARTPDGLTQSQIAQALGRSVQELYRVLMSLERRGYIDRRPPDDACRLTMRLHQLAHAYPPVARMVDTAMPLMRQLALDLRQSFHVSVLDAAHIHVIAQVDSPAPVGFTVRTGAHDLTSRTASGRVLIAHQPPALRRWAEGLVTDPAPGTAAHRGLLDRIEAIARCGYEFVVDETRKGITDVSFPLVDADGTALAALTMPFVFVYSEPVTLETAQRRAFDAAAAISSAIGGRLATPVFPLVDPLRAAGPASD